MNGVNDSPDDGNRLNLIIQAETTFNLVMLNAEIEAHRELIAGLMVRGQQGSDVAAASKNIALVTALKANAQLAALADVHAGFASIYAQKLEHWKKARGIT